jgi:hypothetical protein
MTTTLADFVSPDDDDVQEEQEDEQAQQTVQGDAVKSPFASNNTDNNNDKSLTHQPSISSSSSMAFSPVVAKEPSTLDIPHTSIVPSSPRSVPSTFSHGQYAVYYGGDRKEQLKDGEKLLERYVHSDTSSSVANKDLEHGHGHGPTHNKRHSIVIGLRGSPNLSHASSATNPHVAVAATTEEEYRATIDQLQQRIRDLESRLAAAPGASN